MKLCTTCGNEIEGSAWTCPFCESQQDASATPRRRKSSGIITLYLERERPTVEEALARLERELQSGKRNGVALIRVVHGYGSSGTGGKIRTACRQHLTAKRKMKTIRGFLPGDDYSDTTQAGRALLSTHPRLRSSLRTDSRNPGITFVEL